MADTNGEYDDSIFSATLQHPSSISKEIPTVETDKLSEDNRSTSASKPSGLKSSVVSIPVGVTPQKASDYLDFTDENIVERVLGEKHQTSGRVKFSVEFQNGLMKEIEFNDLIESKNGSKALARFQRESVVGTPRNHGSRSSRQVTVSNDSTDEDEIVVASVTRKSSRQSGQRVSGPRFARRSSRWELKSEPESEVEDDEEPDSESGRRTRISGRRLTRSAVSTTRGRNGGIRQSSKRHDEMFLQSEDSSESEEEEFPMLQSDVLPGSRKRKRLAGNRKKSNAININGMKYEKPIRSRGVRQSERTTRNQQNMKEAGIEDVFRSDSDNEKRTGPPKAIGVRETFQPPSLSNAFGYRHMQQCDTCGNMGSGPHGRLVYCQGCSLAYHTKCLGNRATREHLVTKVDSNNFVLQCRRCIGVAKKKEAIAPDHGMCQSCQAKGAACQPFRVKKTPAQEQKEREENGGEDPVYQVDSKLIDNVDNVLFRCTSCWRAFHFHHLLPRSDIMDTEEDEAAVAAQRYREYGKDWQCRDCINLPAKVSGLVAWRPIDADNYTTGLRTQEVNEDAKEYLIKLEAKSYFKCYWMPGAWVWGITAAAMRRAFEKRNDSNNLPTMTTEDAIPEDYLRIDIVLDVRFTSIVDTRLEEVDKARIREVDQALIKYKGLGYEDAVWEKVPSPDDGERWTDYVKAYDDWVMGRYVHIPKASPMNIRLDKARATPFSNLEKKKQPDNLRGGELMKYQLDGMNWLYYRWYMQQNAILADEMGLGKTIQIIGMLATLVQDHNTFPFLIVVPNSTCPNWRREIKQWAPGLRVVTYFGSALARSLAYQYELYPENSKELRCHIVVTSYDAAADDSCRRFFKNVPWQGLIVDEGQRLKNDKNILYNSLTALKIPYKILLTGTPLQNNARELFNLLQFLDESFNASALELEYAELTKENVPQLHNLIRPFFLRRTKAQVLTFLPPMAQIILPVSMSVVQKKLYMSILAKNPDLLRAIFDHTQRLGNAERANLSNILMQLRKCLCHPFVYSRDIEERSMNPAISHRNLVEASAKLQLLEVLLPKLKERGHRVLIFSQFLNMLDIIEDFLDGLGLQYQRLDGSISSLQKQKRIDEFNARDSDLFAFLLSTRAGGVGINLASADTVIIMDPDFNPHQDIQALSRAHRIGQNKKVLCFQLMTRSSAEEKIIQIGRKKMALDHVLIERMDADDDTVEDVESILRHGAADILEGNTAEDIRYDEASVEKLLDRSQIEDTKAGDDNSAESQFSFARVWANDAASMMDSLNSSDEEDKAPDPSVWEKILKERERVAAEEAAARQEALGRGKRARQAVVYTTAAEQRISSPSRTHTRTHGIDSDSDFQANDGKSAEESAEEDGGNDGKIEAAHELDGLHTKALPASQTQRGILSQSKSSRAPQPPKIFKRANIVWPVTPTAPSLPNVTQLKISDQQNPVVQCIACGTWHRQGLCPLKLAGPEYCNLCGLAHYGISRTCPHIRSETQVREMLEALKHSPEAQYLVREATRYLKGVKGAIVQAKKRKQEKLDAAATTGVSSQQLPRTGPPSLAHSQQQGPNPNHISHSMTGPSQMNTTASPYPHQPSPHPHQAVAHPPPSVVYPHPSVHPTRQWQPAVQAPDRQYPTQPPQMPPQTQPHQQHPPPQGGQFQKFSF